ncbi:MAG: penicillin-insensitive murein endopeptidase [Labrys sp. (in: a-proteobacteria)]|jgi:penicillin-insensitive murein endopeptidase
MRLALLTALLCVAATVAAAQDVTPKGFKLEPLKAVTEATPAKELFGRKPDPAPLEARAIGSYAKGCLAGAVAIPVDGATWQVMRLSRNRNFGHPTLVDFLQRFARTVPTVSSWPGILVGDLSQPRGGPMLTGHASHQIGLDADIWLTPMPKHTLSNEERETLMATNLVAADRLDVDPQRWTPDHLAVIRAAALDPAVHRLFVNPAIKKALCRDATGDRGWLTKVRPIGGHNYHFHIRLGCPAGSGDCKDQDPPPDGDGCGKELGSWFTDAVLNPKKPTTPQKPKPPLIMSDLPAACRQVLVAK